uniref:Uncharacterized protein n=1 Tax=Mola mola TaxID=94237 RepID=A0A3Q3W2C6_MOLML
MEPTVLSGPLGHTQWESEQPFPLGFHTLGSDNGGVRCTNKTGQTGFQDFRNGDQTSHQNEDFVFTDKPVRLDSLINISDFSCGDLKFEGDQSSISQVSLHSTHIGESTLTDKNEGPNEISDCTLSWSFSHELSDVFGKYSASEELSLAEADTKTSNALSSQAELISLGVLPSLSKIPETTTVEPSLLVDLLSNETPCLPSEPSGEMDPQGVSEELVNLSQEEQAGLPPTNNRETLSPETGDKGLFSSQVTDLLVTGRTTLQGTPENSLSQDQISTSLEYVEGSVTLLDLEIPDCDSSPSLCPASPGAPVESSLQECNVKHIGTIVITNPTSEQDENDSLTLDLSMEEAEDAFAPGDFTSESYSVENKYDDLSKKRISSEAKPQGDEAMALDLCLTPKEVRGDKTWDLTPPEGVQNGCIPDLITEQRDERLADTNQLEGSDSPEVASFDFSVQDLHSSAPEAEWTSEQTVTISLSKMVVDDSLPMISAVSTREEDVSPLKAVFDALDQDGDGFVRIEEFMEFAAAYGADQVKDLTKFLDPSGLGVISFEDFHRGITTISNGDPNLYSVNYSQGVGAVCCPEEYDEQNEVTDSAYLGSESTYSECETFTDEDTGALVPPEMHEDVETDSGIEATLHDPEDSGNRSVSLSEEHFEDFGESNTSELLLESSVEGTEGQGDSPLVKPSEQVNGSSILSPRYELVFSRQTDMLYKLNYNLKSLKIVLLLERRVAELEKESETSVEQHARLRQENLQLVHRANALEEQLKEQELHADEQLQQETRRQKEALIKLERERGLELENLQGRLQQLDEENSELRSCVPCLRANIERLEEEKVKLQDDNEAMSERLLDETESRKKMADKLSHERHQSQKEKEATQELIEDLRKQLEHLQLYKLEAEAKRGRTPGAGLQEYQTRTREAELEQEIKRLKQDNRSLKEQNDELNGQIINLSIQGAKNLMSASFSDSLAAEISSVSRTELMEAVHKQEEINYRLQDYIDKIIVAIMESNPSILEVK